MSEPEPKPEPLLLGRRLPTHLELVKALVIAAGALALTRVVAILIAGGRTRQRDEVKADLQAAEAAGERLQTELEATQERVSELESEASRLRLDLAAAGPAPVTVAAPRYLAEAPAPARPAHVAAPPASTVAAAAAPILAAERAAAEKRRAAEAAAAERRRLAALVPRYPVQASGMHKDYPRPRGDPKFQSGGRLVDPA